MLKLEALHDYFKRFIHKHAFLGTICSKTVQFLLHRFNDFDFNYITQKHLVSKLSKVGAKVTFLAKLHKPSLSFRMIENDAGNLLCPCAKYIASYLQSVQDKIDTCLKDSKQLLCHLEDIHGHLVHAKSKHPHAKTVLFTADVVECFPRIDLDKLTVALERVIMNFVNNELIISFVLDACNNKMLPGVNFSTSNMHLKSNPFGTSKL